MFARDRTESVCPSCNWCHPTEKEASNEISLITATRASNGEFSYRIHAERMRVAVERGGGENQFAAAPYRRQPGRYCYSLHPLTVNFYRNGAVTTVLLSKFHCSIRFVAPEEEFTALTTPIS